MTFLMTPSLLLSLCLVNGISSGRPLTSSLANDVSSSLQDAVAGSARAETVKGAGQVIGVAIIVIMLGFGVVPALLQFTPLGPPVGRAVMAWIEFPFALQYFALILVLAGIDVALFFAGRALVQRDRMLL